MIILWQRLQVRQSVQGASDAEAEEEKSVHGITEGDKEHSRVSCCVQNCLCCPGK